MVHSDFFGTIEPPSQGGSKYFITLYDDFSDISSVRFLKKNETLGMLKEMVAELESTAGCFTVKGIRMDNGGE